MKKRIKGRILSRPKSQREALLKSLMGSLFIQGKIKTTEAKAKELRVVAEKSITKAKKNTVFYRRELSRSLPSKAVKKLVDDIAPKYQGRSGGYTRIIKIGPRRSDGARMAIIELV